MQFIKLSSKAVCFYTVCHSSSESPTDFSIMSDKVIGTSSYQAPEIRDRIGRLVSAKPADIHCLGKSLVHSVCGNDTKDSMMKKMYSPNDFINTHRLSPQLAALIISMTDIDPTKRPTIGQIMSDEWLSH